MEERDIKRKYLSQYGVLWLKLKRISEMLLINPEKKNIYIKETNKIKKGLSQIENTIENVDGGLLSEILFSKYICKKSLTRIAEEICYSKRHTERLHIKALDKMKIPAT